ncbi:MauE/DoxX family redox-associated membrane protein [Parachryseolinea silvisoli]|uniref:MauE/DoxX family redox-associated membrane protein n=1 Tax=Parachryseolinea silvisoli TaxID=2873601 RepID=UPI002265AF85|nr:MauE/DoxX family redox-associated membrane protein [Parachryseolinea silvisoli]MCD9015441.1 hypothetical protein [Parachryseolinea silvisoli]
MSRLTENNRSLIITTITFLFMVLFLYAAFTKLADYQTFRGEIGKSPIIYNYANILAWFVPAIEIAATLLLFIPRTRLIGTYISFSIMFAFSLYITMMMIFSPHLPCSCGGILNHLGWTEHLVFNIIFTGLAVVESILITKTSAVYETHLTK